MCFNPRAHVGRDVSRLQSKCFDTCFNPRAHVGRDRLSISSLATTSSFNPRAHVGRDLDVPEASETQSVSIHAPTWGATKAEFEQMQAFRFQSTRPRGARQTFGVELLVD